MSQVNGNGEQFHDFTPAAEPTSKAQNLDQGIESVHPPSLREKESDRESVCVNETDE